MLTSLDQVSGLSVGRFPIIWNGQTFSVQPDVEVSSFKEVAAKVTVDEDTLKTAQLLDSVHALSRNLRLVEASLSIEDAVGDKLYPLIVGITRSLVSAARMTKLTTATWANAQSQQPTEEEIQNLLNRLTSAEEAQARQILLDLPKTEYLISQSLAVYQNQTSRLKVVTNDLQNARYRLDRLALAYSDAVAHNQVLATQLTASVQPIDSAEKVVHAVQDFLNQLMQDQSKLEQSLLDAAGRITEQMTTVRMFNDLAAKAYELYSEVQLRAIQGRESMDLIDTMTLDLGKMMVGVGNRLDKLYEYSQTLLEAGDKTVVDHVGESTKVSMIGPPIPDCPPPDDCTKPPVSIGPCACKGQQWELLEDCQKALGSRCECKKKTDTAIKDHRAIHVLFDDSPSTKTFDAKLSTEPELTTRAFVASNILVDFRNRLASGSKAATILKTDSTVSATDIWNNILNIVGSLPDDTLELGYAVFTDSQAGAGDYGGFILDNAWVRLQKMATHPKLKIRMLIFHIAGRTRDSATFNSTHEDFQNFVKAGKLNGMVSYGEVIRVDEYSSLESNPAFAGMMDLSGYLISDKVMWECSEIEVKPPPVVPIPPIIPPPDPPSPSDPPAPTPPAVDPDADWCFARGLDIGETPTMTGCYVTYAKMDGSVSAVYCFSDEEPNTWYYEFNTKPMDVHGLVWSFKKVMGKELCTKIYKSGHITGNADGADTWVSER